MKAAPYPPDVRAKGWRFELEPERIEQSDTWPLAGEIAMCQHALLMMWFVAWSTQVPCGSFPNDENVIRAKCRIPSEVWLDCRDILMRGWWQADDGRLYHPTLTRRVLEMLDRRRSDADRQAAKRARTRADEDGVTAESRVTSGGLPPESSTDHRPLSTPSGVESAAKPPRGTRKCPADFAVTDELKAFAIGLGVDWQYETAKFRDWTFATTATDWPGRWRNWMRKTAEKRQAVGSGQRSFRERDAEAAAAEVDEWTGGLLGRRQQGTVIDMEEPNRERIAP